MSRGSSTGRPCPGAAADDPSQIGVASSQMDGKTLESGSVLQNTLPIWPFMCWIYAASLLIISLDGMDLTTSLTTAIAATINNIGPGLELVGPMGNFDCFSFLSKIVMIF